MSLDWFGWFVVGFVAGVAAAWLLLKRCLILAKRAGGIHMSDNCPSATAHRFTRPFVGEDKES